MHELRSLQMNAANAKLVACQSMHQHHHIAAVTAAVTVTDTIKRRTVSHKLRLMGYGLTCFAAVTVKR